MYAIHQAVWLNNIAATSYQPRLAHAQLSQALRSIVLTFSPSGDGQKHSNTDNPTASSEAYTMDDASFQELLRKGGISDQFHYSFDSYIAIPHEPTSWSSSSVGLIVIYNLSLSCIALGDTVRSNDLLRLAVTLIPSDFAQLQANEALCALCIYYKLARMHEDFGDAPLALDTYSKALEIGGCGSVEFYEMIAHVYSRLGRLLLNEGHWDDAIVLFEKSNNIREQAAVMMSLPGKSAFNDDALCKGAPAA